MLDKELRKLNRTELLELLLEQSREVERLESELLIANERLISRELSITEAGSIAQAALQVSGIFEAAQQAADQYLENLRSLNEREALDCQGVEYDTRMRMSQLEAATRRACEEKEAAVDAIIEQKLYETQRRCDLMVAQAEERAQAYWDEVSARMLRLARHKQREECPARLLPTLQEEGEKLQ